MGFLLKLISFLYFIMWTRKYKSLQNSPYENPSTLPAAPDERKLTSILDWSAKPADSTLKIFHRFSPSLLHHLALGHHPLSRGLL